MQPDPPPPPDELEPEYNPVTQSNSTDELDDIDLPPEIEPQYNPATSEFIEDKDSDE